MQTIPTQNASPAKLGQIPTIGTRVRMVSENSNWSIGDTGIIIWTGDDRVAVDFDGRRDGDGYTTFLDAFTIILPFKTVYGAVFHGNGHLIGRGHVPATFATRAEAAEMIAGLRQCDTVELYEDASGRLFWDDTDAGSVVPECATGNCQELNDLA